MARKPFLSLASALAAASVAGIVGLVATPAPAGPPTGTVAPIDVAGFEKTDSSLQRQSCGGQLLGDVVRPVQRGVPRFGQTASRQ